MKIVRSTGTSTTLRRCSEFRQLWTELKQDLPQFSYPDVPKKTHLRAL